MISQEFIEKFNREKGKQEVRAKSEVSKLDEKKNDLKREYQQKLREEKKKLDKLFSERLRVKKNENDSEIDKIKEDNKK